MQEGKVLAVGIVFSETGRLLLAYAVDAAGHPPTPDHAIEVRGLDLTGITMLEGEGRSWSDGSYAVAGQIVGGILYAHGPPVAVDLTARPVPGDRPR